MLTENREDSMDSSLCMLIYTSLAIHDMSSDDLTKILDKSRENNAKRNISGLLLYKSGNFLQVLEGPEQAVMESYEVIRHDSRHYQITTVIKRSIVKRDFSQWKMGFTTLSEDDARQIAGFSPYLFDVMTTPELFEHNSIAYVFLEAFRYVMR